MRQRAEAIMYASAELKETLAVFLPAGGLFAVMISQRNFFYCSYFILGTVFVRSSDDSCALLLRRWLGHSRFFANLLEVRTEPICQLLLQLASLIDF